MKKILVVDNSVGDRIRILNALEPEGFQVHEESDGRRAIDTIAHLEPACIITELVLLGLDGFKLIRGVREQGLTIPIVVQTSMTRDTMRDTCLKAGADAFIPKPINTEKLLKTIHEVIAASLADAASLAGKTPGEK